MWMTSAVVKGHGPQLCITRPAAFHFWRPLGERWRLDGLQRSLSENDSKIFTKTYSYILNNLWWWQEWRNHMRWNERGRKRPCNKGSKDHGSVKSSLRLEKDTNARSRWLNWSLRKEEVCRYAEGQEFLLSLTVGGLWRDLKVGCS